MKRCFSVLFMLALLLFGSHVVQAENEQTEDLQEFADEQTIENGTGQEIQYRTHVQTYGWQDWKTDGETAGTTGEAKRLEAVEIRLDEAYNGGVTYRTHIQTYGWQDWVSDGQQSGTTGKAKRLEAIEIQLTGAAAEKYDVFYRVHIQSYGWLGWAKNGETAGSVGHAKRLEALEIRLLPKGTEIGDHTPSCLFSNGISYSSHIQKIGWQEPVLDGGISGTTGEARRLEAVQIQLSEQFHAVFTGSIIYRTHVQTYGWQNWVQEGEVSGTTGEAKRLEAIEIQLTGDLAERYDIYYRVHAQTYGWLGWAKNGEPAGTSGEAKRLEAIQIVLKLKGEAAPGDMANHYKFGAVSDLFDTTESVEGASQIITVIGDGTRTGARLSFLEKTSGKWTERIRNTEAHLGVNGLSSQTREGDGTTPLGSYALGLAFGNKSNPGTALSWVDVNPYHYWIDDPGSAYYNQLIDSREVPSGWASGEHLADYVPSYNYAINIEVNPSCSKNSTSAIFLHCFGNSSYTLGCIAIGEDQKQELLL